MQAERIPTQNEPPASRPPAPAGEDTSIKARKSLSDRILAWSFAGSLFVNAAFIVLLSHADLFGQARNVEEVRHVRVQVYKPPIPTKPKPKPKPPTVKPPPPPPVKVQRVVKPPPPLVKPPPTVRPRVTPPPQHAPPPAPMPIGHIVPQNNTHAVPVAPPNLAPPPTVPVAPAPPNTPAPALPTPAAPTPPAPVVKPTPPAPPVEKPKPQPPAPPVEKPKPVAVVEKPKPEPPKIPDRVEPEIRGSFSDMSLPNVDPGSLNTTSVTVTWEVDERGRVHNVKFRPTGSGEMDDALRRAVQDFRFKPKVVNGQAETAVISHTFDISQ